MRQNIVQLLQDTERDQPKLVRSPNNETIIESNTDSEALGEDLNDMYLNIAGNLIYISRRTRSNVAVATNILVQYKNKPKM